MSDNVYTELPTNINTLEKEKFTLSDEGYIEVRAGSGSGTVYSELPTNINTLEKEKFALDDDGHVVVRTKSSSGGLLEFPTSADFPTVGKAGMLYLAIDTGILYRFDTDHYTEISTTLALGETSTTAYRGDRGKTAYDHTSLTNNPHNVTAAQANAVEANTAITGATKTKITYDAKGLVTAGGDLIESDIPALSIAKTTGLQTALDGMYKTFALGLPEIILPPMPEPEPVKPDPINPDPVEPEPEPEPVDPEPVEPVESKKK